MNAKTREARRTIYTLTSVRQGSIAEEIIKVLHLGRKSKEELLGAIGGSKRAAENTISKLFRRNVLLRSKEDGKRYYRLSELGNYMYLCIELRVSFLMAEVLALAYYNFDASVKRGLSMHFPVTKAEIEEKVSVMGYLCSKESAWARARELASMGYGYAAGGCFILYPYAYQRMREYDSTLRSLYSFVSAIPTKAMLLLLRDDAFRERIERLASALA